MTLPSITNAALTSVRSRTVTDDYDRTQVLGTTKFSGSQPVYYAETSEHVVASPSDVRVASQAESNILIHRQFVVTDELVVAWTVGDVVTIVTPRGTFSGTIRAVRATLGTSLPGVIRMFLEDA